MLAHPRAPFELEGKWHVAVEKQGMAFNKLKRPRYNKVLRAVVKGKSKTISSVFKDILRQMIDLERHLENTLLRADFKDSNIYVEIGLHELPRVTVLKIFNVGSPVTTLTDFISGIYTWDGFRGHSVGEIDQLVNFLNTGAPFNVVPNDHRLIIFWEIDARIKVITSLDSWLSTNNAWNNINFCDPYGLLEPFGTNWQGSISNVKELEPFIKAYEAYNKEAERNMITITSRQDGYIRCCLEFMRNSFEHFATNIKKYKSEIKSREELQICFEIAFPDHVIKLVRLADQLQFVFD